MSGIVPTSRQALDVSASSGRRRWTAAHPRLADAVLASLLVLIVSPTLVVRNPEFPGRPDGWTVVLLAVAAAALVLRREQPLPVWAFTTVVGVAGVLQSDGSIALAAATCVSLYTIGSRLPLRSAVLASLVSGAAYTLAAVVAEGDWLDDRGVPGLQTFAWSAAAAAIGVAVRSSRAALAAAEARALQAELTREEEAQRRVGDERLRIAVLASLASGSAYTLSAIVSEGDWLDDRGVPGLQTFAWSAAAAAIGVAVGSHRSALGAAEARALQAELTREEEAERRVTDERLRIARELHDVVAHHISVVNVQAGVARHLLDADPQQARAALDLVRNASKTALSEMSTVVGLLRTADEGAPTEPTPGMARVGELVDSIRRAGLDLTWTVSGELEGLAAIEDLTAYRVVQEALTNALRYGTGTATMVVTSRPEGVGIEVRNPVRQGDGRRSEGGHGLIGMRERVDAVGGRLATGPGPGGSYQVSAFIPRTPA